FSHSTQHSQPLSFSLSLHDALPIWSIFPTLKTLSALGLGGINRSSFATYSARPKMTCLLFISMADSKRHPLRLCPGLLLFRICQDRKSTRLNSSHRTISYAVFCLKI